MCWSADLIRLVGSGGLARSPSRDAGGAGGRVEEGAKVEANYRGRGRWYPGVVSRLATVGMARSM